MAFTGETIGSEAASPGLWGWLKANSDVIGLGMSGASALGGAASAQAQGALQQQALEQQAQNDALDLAERERAAQENLAKTLSAQNNLFAARGLSASSGSALSAANRADAQAEHNMTGLLAQDLSRVYALKRSGARRSASGAIAGSVLDFGYDAFGLYSGNKKIGQL